MQALTSASYHKDANTVEELIHNCTQMIQHNSIVAGMGNRMIAPVLSVLLGRKSVQCRNRIEDDYFSFWSSQAKGLNFLEGAYDRATIEEAVAQVASNRNYATKNQVRVAWYWDIMDMDFEDHFRCVTQDLSAPLGYVLHRTFYIFCSQRTGSAQTITQQRLSRLIEWATQKNYHLIVLSDMTNFGMLHEDEVSENYHVAATILQLLNSESSDVFSPDRIATNLEFQLGHAASPVWTASYAVCAKQFFDIINVSIEYILDRYLRLANAPKAVTGGRSNMGAFDDLYVAMLEGLFDTVIAPRGISAQEAVFWMDLPYTADLGALEQGLQGGGQSRRGLFGKLFGSKNRGDWTNAIGSVQDFWDTCVWTYYEKPMTEWLASEEGRSAVCEYMYLHLADKLSLNDMKQSLKDEIDKLNRRRDSFDVPMPEPAVGMGLDEYFHSCARAQVKRKLLPVLLQQLVAVMEQLHQHASNFEPMLEAVSESLKMRGVDVNIRRAYGSHMEHLTEHHQEVLNRNIHPTETEAELLGQLEKTFRELVELDASRKYYASLQEDIQFQINVGSSQANNIIDNCFAYDMLHAGRLLSYKQQEGTLYCIMNSTLTQLLRDIDANHIGEKFIANRSDRIERLYLYPIDPDCIQYQ